MEEIEDHKHEWQGSSHGSDNLECRICGAYRYTFLEYDENGYDLYMDIACEHCGRYRVETDGVCEKCTWDNIKHDFVSITRPERNIDNFNEIL